MHIIEQIPEINSLGILMSTASSKSVFSEIKVKMRPQIKIRLMSYELKKVSTLLALTLTVCANAHGQTCRPIEFQEIKEISTQELRHLACDCFSKVRSLNNEYSSAQSSNSLTPTVSRSIEIKSLSAKIEQCQTETDRLAGFLKKRKDLKVVSKTYAFGCLLSGDFVDKYELNK